MIEDREVLTSRSHTSGGTGIGEQRVFVLDRHGKALMPCHPARARTLLDRGRARVARLAPFTIRLIDRTLAESEVDGVQLRIDPGSKATGIALTDEKQEVRPGGPPATVRRGLASVELRHRGAQIRAKMHRRATLRHRRRTANLRHRKPRFHNRSRSPGWLPPSLAHRVDTTVSQVARLMRLAPVTEIHIEQAAFDVHANSADGPLEGTDYQRGTLAGSEVREYLLEKWQRACAYCGVTDVPLEVEHIRPSARGGTDRISNLTLSCRRCNRAKNTTAVADFLADRPEVAAKIARQARTPLTDAAAMNTTRWRLRSRLAELGPPVTGWSGGRTKFNRTRSGLPKTHTLDALCVGELSEETYVVRHPVRPLIITCHGRGIYQRTLTDAYGFPRQRRPRTKRHFGFTTGDLVTAQVPKGKKAGHHRGRLAVRSDGYMNIRTTTKLVTAIHHRHIRLLQRGDGYSYALGGEV
ncbi:RNA-guided endonuclease IscB [Streptomyces sp. NPDC059037]|uniref:RNA-guided endonuclease IscB n=1 Tax=Streptomyces sp. NPDC059037 TaxID=3346710 RepID=UPI0036AFDC1D